MHFEVPKSGFQSFRAFFKEYAMIVVSILTALALEQGLQAIHHRQLAAEASENIETELRSNLKELEDAIHSNELFLASVRKAFQGAIEDRKANVDSATLVKHASETLKGQWGIHFTTPTFRHEAWDVAVANQSASWIPTQKLRLYSGAYADERDSLSAMGSSTNLFLDGPRTVNLMVDIQTTGADANEVVHLLAQVSTSIASGESNLNSLREALKKALAGEAGAKP